ncbi:MAG: hypothetical protein JNK04_11810, partial [Myxococcales bacterium]|nr:hypothetical protein [Myxococcales bacterium]
LAISIVEDPPTSLVSRRLFPVRWAVYGTRAVAAEPHRARWVRLGPPHDTTWLGQWETKHVPDARVAIATPSRRLLVDLVASGAGLGLLPVRLAAEVPGLVEVPMYAPLVGELTRSAWLFTNPDVRRDARVVAVSRVLLEHLKD